MIVFSMREEFLDTDAYRNSLEPMMKELQDSGKWTKVEKSIVPDYFCGKTGVIYRFKVQWPVPYIYVS